MLAVPGKDWLPYSLSFTFCVTYKSPHRQSLVCHRCSVVLVKGESRLVGWVTTEWVSLGLEAQRQ